MPVLSLHVLLLPINVLRLVQIEKRPVAARASLIAGGKRSGVPTNFSS